MESVEKSHTTRDHGSERFSKQVLNPYANANAVSSEDLYFHWHKFGVEVVSSIITTESAQVIGRSREDNAHQKHTTATASSAGIERKFSSYDWYTPT